VTEVPDLGAAADGRPLVHEARGVDVKIRH
jgi:hypothetical protein